MIPQRVTLTPEALLLDWDDHSQRLSADALRRACRCADCLAGRSAPSATQTHLREARPVGHYALQLCFDDGHERGIYPWPYLAALQREATLG
ncbi:DUF971 domain-containing protein [Niveibacterium sp. SC-1]|uniref:DUF971 domain-containing protein n=1 Tax=Niveibacterium sp. SC-1 TaxID=3135646 RepID=UPI00311FD943